MKGMPDERCQILAPLGQLVDLSIERKTNPEKERVIEIDARTMQIMGEIALDSEPLTSTQQSRLNSIQRIVES